MKITHSETPEIRKTFVGVEDLPNGVYQVSSSPPRPYMGDETCVVIVSDGGKLLLYYNKESGDFELLDKEIWKHEHLTLMDKPFTLTFIN